MESHMRGADSLVDGLKALAQAQEYLRTAVAGVPDGAWGNSTPCTAWTVRQVLNHARIDQQRYGAAVTGVGAPEEDAFQPVDALDTDHLQRLDLAQAATAAAYADVPEGAETVPTPIGPKTPTLGALAAALDAGVHAWDIAVATGQDLPMDDDLAEALMVIATEVVNNIRDEYGVYAPTVELPADAGPAERLLAFVGRDPDWKHP